MDREDGAAFLHSLVKQKVGLAHHDGVAGFQRYYNIVEFLVYAHRKPLHCSLFHAFRGISVPVDDVFSKRTVVKPDSDGCFIFSADFYKTGELALGVLVYLGEIARVDPDLVCNLGGCDSNFGIEVDIGDKRGIYALVP